MKSEIMLKISAMKTGMTNAEKKVADYVLKNPREVLGCSISELAELCGVGETSVFRFCKTLECEGFSGFKMEVALSLSDSEMEDILLTREISRGDGPELVGEKLLASHISALQNTRRLADFDAIGRAAGLMLRAGRIVLAGAGGSLVPAMGAYFRFLRITPKIHCAQDSHARAMEASLCGPGDVLIAVSCSGMTVDTVECARLAKAGGASVISITRHLRTPLAQNSDIILLDGSSESSGQPAPASSMSAALYILDMLYVEYFRRSYGAALENMDKTTSSVMKKLL